MKQLALAYWRRGAAQTSAAGVGGVGEPGGAGGAAGLDETGWKMTASDTFADSSPMNMIDGQPSVRWASGINQFAGMWILLDMAKPQKFSAITLDSRAWPSDVGTSYDVYTSLDANFSVPTRRAVVGSATQVLSFQPAIVARYLKMVLTSPHDAWWSVGELTINR